jgi:hypothetical protein
LGLEPVHRDGGIQPLLLPIAIATLIFHVQSSESLRPAGEKLKKKQTDSPSYIPFPFLGAYYYRRPLLVFIYFFFSFNFFYLTALWPEKYNQDKKGERITSQSDIQ